MNKTKLIITALTILGLALFISPTAFASPCFGIPEEAWDVEICGPLDNPYDTRAENYVQNILNMVFFALGILAVGFIVYGGIKYILSAGDPNKIATAKSTILYAAIGIVVALSAFAITTFVFSRIAG